MERTRKISGELKKVPDDVKEHRVSGWIWRQEKEI
jgi:hypothetical protein